MDGVLPTLNGATYPQGNFDILEYRQNFTASASADWVASSRWYVGARAGYFTSNRTTDNVVEETLFVFGRTNRDLLDVPEPLQQDVGFRTDISNEVSNVDRLSRVNAQIDATLFGRLAGPHTLKGGLQLDRRSNDVNKGGSANGVFLHVGRAGAGRSARHLRLISRVQQPRRTEARRDHPRHGERHDDRPVRAGCVDGLGSARRSTSGCGPRTRRCRSTRRWDRQGPSRRSISRCWTSWRRGPGRRGTSRATADGRCTEAGASSTTSSSWPCRSWRSAERSRRTTSSSSRHMTGRTSSTARIVLRRVRAGRHGRLCGSTRRSRTSIPAWIRCAREELTVGVEHQLTARLAVSARFVHKQIDKAVEDIGSVDDGRQFRLRHRQSRLRARHRSVRRRAVSQGRSRLRRRGARRSTAPRAELGAHGQLRLEPPARQLLRALAVRRERTHGPQRRHHVRRRTRPVRRRRPGHRRSAGDGPAAPGQGAARVHGAVRRQRGGLSDGWRADCR